MKTSREISPNFVLIDFENVHPKNLSILHDEHFQIRLFLGAKQTKLDVAIVDAMHTIGPERAKYISALQSGKNALDFYITYYLGQLVSANPEGYFHLISKDKGFDPLVAHLVSSGVKVRRYASLMDIPIVGVTKSADMNDKIEAVVTNLRARGASKPRKEATLKNTIKNMFKGDISEKEVLKIFQKLLDSKQIAVVNEKIAYHLKG
ncbi:MAG: PIN domain-containing protein [Litorimonas sp.]